MDEELKRTPLYDEHKKLGARFVGFGGWEMPVQYRGVIEEHNAVRSKVGLFDVSHMGEVRVRGSKAFDALQWLLTNDLSKLKPGRAQYSVLANKSGGAVDDVIVYQMGSEDFLICVNASNRQKDFKWMLENNPFGANIEDHSDDYVQLAVQGPNAKPLVEELLKTELDVESFSAFSHKSFSISLASGAITGILARTGYTGEDGFELYCPAASGAALWREILSVGEKFEIQPIGLGARDTLRLEAALCLYGHELRDDIDILSAGLGWVTKFQKGDFIGKEALFELRERGLPKRLVGLELLEPGIAREATPVRSVSGESIGFVTSGTKTPTVGKSIALAYIDAPHCNVHGQLDAEVCCEVRGRKIRSKIVPIPFYKRRR